MTGLIPFNRTHGNLAGTTFKDFYKTLGDFFDDGFVTKRNLLRDTFKMDIQEQENEYLIEAELPGISKDEIDLKIDDETLCITANRTEETDKAGKNYVHKERHTTSMSRSVKLVDAKLAEIKAKLENGILTVTVPKDIKTATSRKIEIE